MYRYRCQKCGRVQFSSSELKEKEPCVYCGNQGTKIEGVGNMKSDDRHDDNKEDIKNENSKRN